jgi:molybdenum cofactor cytidylyltransferase
MISAILLAAGQSTRMNGENKLVKEIKGTPLIHYAVQNILLSSVDEIVIVTGFESELIEKIIGKNKKIKFVLNDNYKDGISSSIKKGIKNLSKKSEAFFICLGDMPMVKQSVYNKLIKSRYNYNKKKKPLDKKEIIIPTYSDQAGNPILFSKYMKDKIMQINGDVGAKKIIELNKKNILNIPFKSKGITLDFDTKTDFLDES